MKARETMYYWDYNGNEVQLRAWPDASPRHLLAARSSGACWEAWRKPGTTDQQIVKHMERDLKTMVSNGIDRQVAIDALSKIDEFASLSSLASRQ